MFGEIQPAVKKETKKSDHLYTYRNCPYVDRICCSSWHDAGEGTV